MYSCVTRYTSLSFAVILRDEMSGPRCFSGSGFPMPRKGSRRASFMSSNTRSATRWSVATQWAKSSMHSSWTTVTRFGEDESLDDPFDRLLRKAEFLHQGLELHGLDLLFLRAGEGSE